MKRAPLDYKKEQIKMSKDPVVREIRRATRRHFSAERKIEIVLEGLRGEVSVSELCRREGVNPPNYYKWSKAFLDAGKNGLTVDTKRNATNDEVKELKAENSDLKSLVAELTLEVQRRKKSLGL
jgi:transposase